MFSWLLRFRCPDKISCPLTIHILHSFSDIHNSLNKHKNREKKKSEVIIPQNFPIFEVTDLKNILATTSTLHNSITGSLFKVLNFLVNTKRNAKLHGYYISYEFHLGGKTGCEYHPSIFLNLSEVWILILSLSCYFSSKILPVDFFL